MKHSLICPACGRRGLSLAALSAIRAGLRRGEKQAALALEAGVSQSMVSLIRAGKRRKGR